MALVDQLVLFASVVDAGSFAAAARELGITRQSVSERIGKLEAELGVRLLERTTRSLRPTSAGAVLHERARDVARLASEARAEVVGMQSEPVGLLRVTVPGAFGRMYMPVIASELLSRYPQLEMEVRLLDRRVDLVKERFDAGVRVGLLEDSTLVRQKVGQERLVFVASPDYLRRRGMPSGDRIQEHACIGFVRRERWHLGGSEREVAPRLVLDDVEAVLAATERGVGISRLPGFVVAAAVHRGDLRVIFADEHTPTRKIWVVYPSRRYLAPKVRCFIEMVEAHAKVAFGAELEVAGD